jgi:cyclopropane fatty-acyl-phospholipid synthase-like methyltransferase
MDYNIDYNDISENYSIYRNASPTVVDHILEKIKNKNIKEILEIGCGTADYLYALTQQLKCNSYGFDNSENMISEANKKNPGLKLKINDLHKVFDYNDNFFDLVYSIDVVHYVKDLDHYFKEIKRVLNKNGVLITITDSEEDLENRTITKYFPESLEIEMKRYPGVNEIIENMKNSDFKGIEISHTEKEYKMDEKIFQKFKNKAFSAIRLISEESFEKGIKKVKKDMKNNKCLVKELYTYIWGVKQHF